MIEVAIRNGISKSLFNQRINILKWSEEKASTEPIAKKISTRKSEWAVYKGDELLIIGTLEECAEHLNVKPKTVYYYSMESYQERVKNPRNRLLAVRLDEEE